MASARYSPQIIRAITGGAMQAKSVARTYQIPSFTIELRPQSVEQGGFILPASQIVPTYEENRLATFYLIDRLLPTPAQTLAAE